MASRVPISPLSAAYILVDWIAAHGREPRLRECCSSNSLLFWRTFLDKIPAPTFSACISTARALVSHAPPPRMQSCLGPDCQTRFSYQGYHFCDRCRAALGYDNEDIRATGQYWRAHNRENAAYENRHGAHSEPMAQSLFYDDRGYLTSRTGQKMSFPPLDGASIDDDIFDELCQEAAPRAAGTAYSFDDMIALQLTTWRRISKKRRFFKKP